MVSSRDKPLFIVENLKKNYGKLEAVKEVSLQVNYGEVFGFLGPNGAGKTTTIKCCTGLLHPNTGSIMIEGFDLHQEPVQAKARIGYVPDDPFLYEKLTGEELVTFIARLYGQNEDGLKDKVDRYFELLEMRDSKNHFIQSYSRGMRQKTALIAAILHEPTLLFLDEPTANLDPRSARIVKDLIQHFKEQRRAVLLSTHIMEIAESLCDRVAIINQGKIEALGSLKELDQWKQGGTLEEVFLEITSSQDLETQKVLNEVSRPEKGEG